MKFYSEDLKRFFDTEEQCLAEEEKARAKSMTYEDVKGRNSDNKNGIVGTIEKANRAKAENALKKSTSPVKKLDNATVNKRKSTATKSSGSKKSTSTTTKKTTTKTTKTKTDTKNKDNK